MRKYPDNAGFAIGRLSEVAFFWTQRQISGTIKYNGFDPVQYKYYKHSADILWLLNSAFTF